MSEGRVRAGSGLSAHADPARAGAEAAALAAAALDGRPSDLAVVFASGRNLSLPERLLDGIHDQLAPAVLIGCGAGGILADGHEQEDGSAVAVWALSVGEGGEVEPFRAVAELSDEEDQIVLAGDLSAADSTLLLADPYTFAAEAALARLHELAPAMPVLGGVASASTESGSAALFLNENVCEHGAVGVRLNGIELIPCVSQGAAPLGPELTVTSSEGNVIFELAGRPALETLERVVSGLPPVERALLAPGVLFGIVVDPGKPEFEQGDFLVRGLLGADRESGALAIGAAVQPGQIVRLHARDARSADEDLQRALQLRTQALSGRRPAGALVFSCNGRGRAMFGAEDHDAAAVRAGLGGAPSAGFFAAGEFGPVAGRSYLHSFTATIALFAG
jgi:small ligand-binding sensory domain FIST